MIKFMFAPFAGPRVKLNFWETYICCVSGAIVAAAVFFYLSNYFMKLDAEKKKRKQLLAEQQGKPYKKKKTFTKMNRGIIRVKRSLGIIGTAFWVPFFLSIPIGSIITAKFYRKDKRTFPLIILGIFVNAIITTGIAYLIG